ncbi:MAG: SsrA-binding protein SmpB [Planctomycetia bacterium]|nr:SsrA-binding protein SmpB [Planctomycetia bacterium]
MVKCRRVAAECTLRKNRCPPAPRRSPCAVTNPKPTRPQAGRKAARGDEKPQERVVAENRKARHEYEVIDTLECGIALVGSEVKSLRAGRMSLDEAYGRVDGREVWLLGCDIPEYEKANRLNHPPKRPRKLLMHRREISRFAGQALEKGLTLVPLKMYFKEGRVKVLMGIGRGRKLHDKREKLKAASARRDIEAGMRRESRRGI